MIFMKYSLPTLLIALLFSCASVIGKVDPRHPRFLQTNGEIGRVNCENTFKANSLNSDTTVAEALQMCFGKDYNYRINENWCLRGTKEKFWKVVGGLSRGSKTAEDVLTESYLENGAKPFVDSDGTETWGGWWELAVLALNGELENQKLYINDQIEIAERITFYETRLFSFCTIYHSKY